MKTDEGSLSGTPSSATYSVNAKRPRWGQCVAVVTPHFHCRGFLASGAKWHRQTDGSMIENVQAWYLIDADEVRGDEAPPFWRAIPHLLPGSPLPTWRDCREWTVRLV